ncbi:hypothetical protein T11_9101 [Trichinella zimbabwensis]|uniref:Uncharacterized protein n=1 Tax=Trichinella zimbabwensis TaxID=268475 RepID=A0A0V1GNH4_9BILA|nr:hypothetical protein T11_9101 [Trichinella zimbabwensis]
MEGKLVGRKRHWCYQNVGEFLRRKWHLAEKCVQSCLGESRPGKDKIVVVWILWRRNGTGLKKSLQFCSGESRAGPKKFKGNWWGGTALVQAKCRGVFREKTARSGKRIVEVCFGESRPGTNKILLVWILWRGNGTVQKRSL